MLADGGVALVHDLQQLGLGDDLAGSGDRELANLEVLLAVEKHHGAEVWNEGIVREGGFDIKLGDDTVGGKDLKVLSALATLSVRTDVSLLGIKRQGGTEWGITYKT